MYLITRITPQNKNAKFEILTSVCYGTEEEANAAAKEMSLKHFGRHFNVLEVKATFVGKKIVEEKGV